MKGPVAIAGSIPLLFKNSGIKVPIIPATITTATNAIDKAKAISIAASCSDRLKSNMLN